MRAATQTAATLHLHVHVLTALSCLTLSCGACGPVCCGCAEVAADHANQPSVTPGGGPQPNRGSPVNRQCADDSDAPHRFSIQLPANVQHGDLHAYTMWEWPGCPAAPCLHPMQVNANTDSVPRIFDPVPDGHVSVPKLVGGGWRATGWACWHGVGHRVAVLIYMGQPSHAAAHRCALPVATVAFVREAGALKSRCQVCWGEARLSPDPGSRGCDPAA